jgi:hypothetical protein
MRNLFRGSLLVAITLFLGTLNVNAQTGAPCFSDYPVNERYNGRTAPSFCRARLESFAPV